MVAVTIVIVVGLVLSTVALPMADCMTTDEALPADQPLDPEPPEVEGGGRRDRSGARGV